ncbi:iron-siderophore ABC transporter permease, partial [Staphylococcus epidermidis]|nr:iron-siderophore ABC transporter permease [Staphylococcus epidermidis]
MTMVNKDSQSAIEQKKKKRTTLTFIVGVCLLFISENLNLAIVFQKIN